MVRSIGFGLAIATAVVARHAQAGLITVSNSETLVTAFEPGTGQSGPVSNQSTTIPKLTTIAAGIGGVSSSTTIHFFHQGAGSVLNWDFEQVRSGRLGGFNSFADLQVPLLLNRFTVSSDTTYTLSGFFDLTGSGLIQLQAVMLDNTAGAELFSNIQESINQANKHLTLGQTAGNSFNTLSGSLSGNLLAGHEYWIGTIAIITNVSADAGASAVGNFRLEVGDLDAAEAVPEPSSCTLAAFGAAGIMHCVRRRRRAMCNRRLAS